IGRAWHLREGWPTYRSECLSSSSGGSCARSDPRIRRVVVEYVVPPAPLALADAPEVLDQLDAVDPLSHLVAELVLDPEAQGRAVLDRQWRPVHLVRKEHLRPARRLEVDDLVVVAVARVRPLLIEGVENEIPGGRLRPRLFQEVRYPDASPGSEIGPALYAGVQGRLRAARHGAKLGERQAQWRLDQAVDAQPPVVDPPSEGARIGLVLRGGSIRAGIRRDGAMVLL